MNKHMGFDGIYGKKYKKIEKFNNILFYNNYLK